MKNESTNGRQFSLNIDLYAVLFTFRKSLHNLVEMALLKEGDISFLQLDEACL